MTLSIPSISSSHFLGSKPRRPGLISSALLFRGTEEAKSADSVEITKSPEIPEIPEIPQDDGSLKPVTVHIKVIKHPAESSEPGKLELFINTGDLDNPDDETNFPLETQDLRLIAHDMIDHVLTSSSFCALPNIGGEHLHGFGQNLDPFEFIPLGAMDYVQLMRRQTSKTDPSKLFVMDLLNEFGETSQKIKHSHELVFSVTIPPPDRSYSIAKNSKWVPKSLRTLVSPSEINLDQLEKQGFLKTVKKSPHFKPSIEYQIYDSQKRECLTYSHDADDVSYIIKETTLFYPIESTEEYTGLPYQPMTIDNIRVRPVKKQNTFAHRFLEKLSYKNKTKALRSNILAFKTGFRQMEENKKQALTNRPFLTSDSIFVATSYINLNPFSYWLDELKDRGFLKKESPLTFEGPNNFFRLLFQKLVPKNHIHKNQFPEGMGFQFIEIPPPLPAMTPEKLESEKLRKSQ